MSNISIERLRDRCKDADKTKEIKVGGRDDDIPIPTSLARPEWQRLVHEWNRSEADRRSNQLRGEIEQPHAYAWSTVMRVPSSEGTLFFNATAPETIYEIAMTEKLAGWFPNCMPELIAMDTARG